MTQNEAKKLTRGQAVLVDGKPATFVTLHSANHTPGRYSARAIVSRFEAGREREMSVRLGSLSLPTEESA